MLLLKRVSISIPEEDILNRTAIRNKLEAKIDIDKKETTSGIVINGQHRQFNLNDFLALKSMHI